MRKLLVLGAGTAGTMVVNKLSHMLDDDWSITIVDQTPEHHYQPGYLVHVPFGTYQPSQIRKPKREVHPQRASNLVMGDSLKVSTGRRGTSWCWTMVRELDVRLSGDRDRGDATSQRDRRACSGSEWRESRFLTSIRSKARRRSSRKVA